MKKIIAIFIMFLLTVPCSGYVNKEYDAYTTDYTSTEDYINSVSIEDSLSLDTVYFDEYDVTWIGREENTIYEVFPIVNLITGEKELFTITIATLSQDKAILTVFSSEDNLYVPFYKSGKYYVAIFYDKTTPEIDVRIWRNYLTDCVTYSDTIACVFEQYINETHSNITYVIYDLDFNEDSATSMIVQTRDYPPKVYHGVYNIINYGGQLFECEEYTAECSPTVQTGLGEVNILTRVTGYNQYYIAVLAPYYTKIFNQNWGTLFNQPYPCILDQGRNTLYCRVSQMEVRKYVYPFSSYTVKYVNVGSFYGSILNVFNSDVFFTGQKLINFDTPAVLASVSNPVSSCAGYSPDEMICQGHSQYIYLLKFKYVSQTTTTTTSTTSTSAATSTSSTTSSTRPFGGLEDGLTEYLTYPIDATDNIITYFTEKTNELANNTISYDLMNEITGGLKKNEDEAVNAILFFLDMFFVITILVFIESLIYAVKSKKR